MNEQRNAVPKIFYGYQQTFIQRLPAVENKQSIESAVSLRISKLRIIYTNPIQVL